MVFTLRGEGVGIENFVGGSVSNFYSRPENYSQDGVIKRAWQGIKRYGAVGLVGLAGLVGCTPQQTRGVVQGLAYHAAEEKVSNIFNPEQVNVTVNNPAFSNSQSIVGAGGRIAMPHYIGRKACIHYSNGTWDKGILDIDASGYLIWKGKVGELNKIMSLGRDKDPVYIITTGNAGSFTLEDREGPRLSYFVNAELERLNNEKIISARSNNQNNPQERCFSSANYQIDKNGDNMMGNDEVPVAKSIFQPGEKVRLISKWSFRKGRNASVIVKKIEGQNSSIKMSHDLGIIPGDLWYLANEKETISVRTNEEGEYLVEYLLDGRRIEGMSHSFFVNSNK